MKEVIEFLDKNQNGFFATVCNGEPRVRPWQFMFEKDKKLWFCTGSFKEVYKQLEACPKVEFTSMAKDFTTVRVRGEIKFCDDIEVKKEVLDRNPLVKKLYKTPDNPVFKTFYIEHGTAIMADFSGNTPTTIEF